MRAFCAKSFWRARGGTSAVEFAIILPVFLTIMMGIIEFGLIIYTFNAEENAARDAARRWASNRITSSSVQSVVTSDLPAWVANAATVNTSQTTPGTPTTNIITVDVYIPAASASPTSFLSWAYKSITLHSRVRMQQEPTS